MDDAALIQRTVAAALTGGAEGRLPRIPWSLGLSVLEAAGLRKRWALACTQWDAIEAQAPAVPYDGDTAMLVPLRSLLFDHRSVPAPEYTVLANAVACGCFGPHHLWQDLGADGRPDVSRLMRTAFTRLHDGNQAQLKWKRYLFLCLGARVGRDEVRPPKCAGCDDFDTCYGPAVPGTFTLVPIDRRPP